MIKSLILFHYVLFIHLSGYIQKYVSFRMNFNGSQLTCQVISSGLQGFQWPEVSQKSKSSSALKTCCRIKKSPDEQSHRCHRVWCLPYIQGRQGRFLAGKDAIVAATSPARRRCPLRFLFSKSSQGCQGPSLGCLASRGGPVYY